MKNQSFDFSVNVLAALLWQYNDAEKLIALLRSKQVWYDENQSEFWEAWTRDVFNLDTATDFGCTVWSIILGVPLTVVLPPDYLNKLCFGFSPFGGNFDRSNFGSKTQTDQNLTLAQKRLVLKLRYFQLISRGTVPQTNYFMKWAFEDLGVVYVLDPLDMGEIVYVFTFALPSALIFVLTYYDILPRPAGVGIRFVVTVRENFGFAPYGVNFDRGNFGA